MIYFKSQIFDRKALVEPHLLIEGAYVFYLKHIGIGVEVIGGIKQGQALFLNHLVKGEFVHDGAIGLEVEDALRGDNFAVSLEELRGGETVTCIAFPLARMGIGESDPNLANLTRAKEMLNLVDAGTDEGYILKTFVTSLSEATPHTGSFDVDTDVIDFGMYPGQAYGIFTFTTTQLQHDGMVVMKKVGTPMAFQRKTFRHDSLIGLLEQVVERPVLFKFLQFVLLAHRGYFVKIQDLGL